MGESVQGKIICLVGPPGVGKTSVGRSIARALDRKFFRFSVGGLYDVAELRGHRRTYVGAMPGKIIQCLKITGSSNPLVLIDEVDKLGRDYRGDPSSALLEILDPEQNNTFRDHYLDVPMDLSRILFMCTANVLDTISSPLRDRMEVIRLAGYIFEEKRAIANQFLIPKTMEASGVKKDSLELTQDALDKIIQDYAREAGVRQLRKLLEKLSRKAALRIVRNSGVEDAAKTVVTLDNLTEYIGQPKHLSDRLYYDGTPPGVSLGLAWTRLGGSSLYVEATGRVPSRNDTDKRDSDDEDSFSSMRGTMNVTGQLGKVMQESSQISLTYGRQFVKELSPSTNFLDEAHIHLHVPEGATPKDGPSAGITMTSALVSLALGTSLAKDVAMTGELSLMGKVLRVGGIKEKVIAARRDDIKTVLLPLLNRAEYMELEAYLRSGLTAHFVDHYDDVYRLAFGDAGPQLQWPSRGLPVVTEYSEMASEPVTGTVTTPSDLRQDLQTQ